MSFRVVEENSQSKSTTQMVVVLEGNNPEELRSANARNEVLSYARLNGFPARGLSGIPHPYPVDENGETTDEVVTGKKPISAWRADYPVMSSN